MCDGLNVIVKLNQMNITIRRERKQQPTKTTNKTGPHSDDEINEKHEIKIDRWKSLI